jgi:hypothetical protein
MRWNAGPSRRQTLPDDKGEARGGQNQAWQDLEVDETRRWRRASGSSFWTRLWGGIQACVSPALVAKSLSTAETQMRDRSHRILV